MVSEIGFGAEWMERHTAGECRAVLDRAEELGINILDCWMSNPEVRSSLGQALVHPGARRLHLAGRAVCPHPGRGQVQGGL